MRVLVISDIHGNITALKSVFKAAGSLDAVWCLGDLVGYGPDPNECIETIRSQPNLMCLLGNHDAAALGYLDMQSFNQEAQISMEYMQRNLSRENLQFLASLSQKEVIGQVTLSHGSPRNPIWEYLLDAYTVAENFPAFDTQLCFVGHTHIQLIYSQRPDGGVSWNAPELGIALPLRERLILNPGSVGQPRDHDPRASFALFDSELCTWEARRVEYDIESVQRRIREAGLPIRHALRLSEGW